MKRKKWTAVCLIMSFMLNTFYVNAATGEAYDESLLGETGAIEEVLPDENKQPTEDILGNDLNTIETDNSDLTAKDELLPFSENVEVAELSAVVDQTAETTAQLSWGNLGEGYTYVISLNGVIVGECTENTYQIMNSFYSFSYCAIVLWWLSIGNSPGNNLHCYLFCRYSECRYIHERAPIRGTWQSLPIPCR